MNIKKAFAPMGSDCGQAKADDWSVYPNPSNGNFNISYQSEINTTALIRIMDINGRIISTKSHQLEIGNNNLFISEYLVKGIYLVKVITNNKELNPIKLVVN